MSCKWKECTLGDLITFQRGHDLPKNKMTDGKYPVVGSNGIIGYHNEYTTESPSITIGRSGNVGNPFIFYGRTWSHNTTLYVKDFKGNDPVFVFYFLKTLDLVNYSGGSAVPTLNRNHIHTLPIKVPESAEIQKKIGYYLRLLDEKIATNRAINDNLYEMVNAYYTSLFKDVECEMTTIDNYAERIYSGGTPATSNATYWGGAFGWFSSGETRNRFVISTEKSITQTGIDNSSTKLAAKHDIVMASAGQGFTRGQTSMLLIDTYVNQSVIVIHADKNTIPYLFWNLANRYEELRAISDSSSIRGSLTTKMIAAFEIPLANNDAIQTFSDFAWAVIPKIENNLLENVRLAALRDSLLPKLMSGEIDVSAVQL
ncbi:MAG: restriction endonuclease subunit S [Eubacteriales bacterium]|nr:restriction endonuclease subunit S [Eubacteriales bacterium]